MTPHEAQKWRAVLLLSLLLFGTRVDAEAPMHEAAIVRLGKAMQLEETLSRGVEVGLALQFKNHPELVPNFLDCVNIDEMKRLTRAEWVRIYGNHLSAEDANAISHYLESSGGVKLGARVRACWGGPGAPDHCDPVRILNDVERAALVDFEASRANETFKKVQLLAQKELMGFTRELYTKKSAQCLKLIR